MITEYSDIVTERIEPVMFDSDILISLIFVQLASHDAIRAYVRQKSFPLLRRTGVQIQVYN
jgi:hypothetical protein